MDSINVGDTVYRTSETSGRKGKVTEQVQDFHSGLWHDIVQWEDNKKELVPENELTLASPEERLQAVETLEERAKAIQKEREEYRKKREKGIAASLKHSLTEEQEQTIRLACLLHSNTLDTFLRDASIYGVQDGVVLLKDKSYEALLLLKDDTITKVAYFINTDKVNKEEFVDRYEEYKND